jgi:hypothetical protein
MSASTRYAVAYGANAQGYVVQTIQDGRVVDEYHAGNAVKESTTYVKPRSRYAVTLRQLRKWAKQTAGEIAAELGEHVPIEHDPDLDVLPGDRE